MIRNKVKQTSVSTEFSYTGTDGKPFKFGVFQPDWESDHYQVMTKDGDFLPPYDGPGGDIVDSYEPYLSMGLVCLDILNLEDIKDYLDDDQLTELLGDLGKLDVNSDLIILLKKFIETGDLIDNQNLSAYLETERTELAEEISGEASDYLGFGDSVDKGRDDSHDQLSDKYGLSENEYMWMTEGEGLEDDEDEDETHDMRISKKILEHIT